MFLVPFLRQDDAESSWLFLRVAASRGPALCGEGSSNHSWQNVKETWRWFGNSRSHRNPIIGQVPEKLLICAATGCSPTQVQIQAYLQTTAKFSSILHAKILKQISPPVLNDVFWDVITFTHTNTVEAVEGHNKTPYYACQIQQLKLKTFSLLDHNCNISNSFYKEQNLMAVMDFSTP